MLVALLALPCIIVPETIYKTFNVGDDAIDYALHDVNLVALSTFSLFICTPTTTLLLSFTLFFLPVIERVADVRTKGNPVREHGPPVCMAKLIMLRHKVCIHSHPEKASFLILVLIPSHDLLSPSSNPQINQAGHKKRKASPPTHVARHTHTHTRSLSRTTNVAQRARAFSWMKFGKQAH